MKFQIIAGELCLDFINTLDNRPVPERKKELLETYGDLVDWAMQAGTLSPAQHRRLERDSASRPKEAEAVRKRAVELREALFRILTAVTGKRTPAEEDLQTFNAYLREGLSHLELRAAGKGFSLDLVESPLRLDSVLWPIVRSANDLLTGNDLDHIRECDVETCRWLFVDRSKNHSRRWCDMKICGNRVKAKKFYRRQSGETQSRRDRLRAV